MAFSRVMYCLMMGFGFGTVFFGIQVNLIGLRDQCIRMRLRR